METWLSEKLSLVEKRKLHVVIAGYDRLLPNKTRD